MSTPTAPSPTLAVGVTPMETRHDVVVHLAERAEALGYDAFLLAEGWGHDAAVLLAAIAGGPAGSVSAPECSTSGDAARPRSRCWRPPWTR